eukprot:1136864-Pelagomonas_calceolata.AAC.15
MGKGAARTGSTGVTRWYKMAVCRKTRQLPELASNLSKAHKPSTFKHGSHAEDLQVAHKQNNSKRGPHAEDLQAWLTSRAPLSMGHMKSTSEQLSQAEHFQALAKRREPLSILSSWFCLAHSGSTAN